MQAFRSDSDLEFLSRSQHEILSARNIWKPILYARAAETARLAYGESHLLREEKSTQKDLNGYTRS